jgi:hypothetical protein
MPEAASASEASEAPPETPAKAEDTEKAEPKVVTSAAAEPASSDELDVILQRVIEDEELDKVLHLTLPGRFPLKASGTDLPSGLALTKAGKPVTIVSAPSSKTDPVLVFTQIDVGPKEATVGYRYDVEGIRGVARLKKGAQGWELTSSRLVEH